MKDLKSNLYIKEKLNLLRTTWSFKQLIALFFTTCLLATFNFLPMKLVHFHTAVGYTKDAINVVLVDYNKYYRSQKKMPLILLWTPFYSQEDYGFGLGHEAFKDQECPVSNCIMSKNRSLINESDAVIFHIRDTELNDLPDPRFRKPHQYYIFYLYETPVHTYLDLKAMKGFFNWTITYRMDSDIVDTYDYFSLINSTDINVAKKRIVNRTASEEPRKLVLWLVSNCETDGGREYYIEELRKYIQVDEYGNCIQRRINDTYAMSLFPKYKFYLSFENSLCKDYITEKYYKILHHPVVPVCYGLGNYSAVGPPNSYIDARNFDSPHKLADYLVELDANETAYNQYLAWQTKYYLHMHNESYHFCELCKRLNGHNPTKIYHNIYNWWHNGAENSKRNMCVKKLPYTI